MSPSKPTSVNYTPLPSSLPDDHHQNIVLLLPYHHNHSHRHLHRRLRRCFLFSAASILLVAAVFFLYPFDPDIQLVRVNLNKIKVNATPQISLDLSFAALIKVRNRDLFSLDYETLNISVGYRGRELGFVKSDGGRVTARGSSYVNATVDVDGIEVVHDVFYLLEDLAKGSIPFDTNAEIKGKLGLFFFDVPINAKVSCEVIVNTSNQTIIHQDCYPA